MSRQYFFTGTAAPAFTPEFAGSLFVDTVAGKIYFATGTVSSADWDVLPQLLSQLTVDSDLNLLGVFKLLNAQGIDFQASSELTIATGVITQTQTLHSVDTQSEGPSDDLDTITPDSDLNVLILKQENAARVVTLKHGTGNLLLPDDKDLIMRFNVNYMFIFNTTNWVLASNSNTDLTSVNGWTGQQFFAEVPLSDGANIAWDLDLNQTATVTLAGNRTLDNPTNQNAGSTYIIRVVQDPTGTRTLAFGSAYQWSGGTAPTLTATSNAVDVLTFYSDGTNMLGDFTLDLQ